MKKFVFNILQITLTLLMSYGNLLSQNVFSQIDNQRDIEPMQFPWAGGMDAIQYCEIDFNMDGVMDLLAFDRRGNRKMCFINNGTINEIDYQYAPQYSSLLPDFNEWVIFRDYNLDGKNDIFTYSSGYVGIIVYKNISEFDLKFEIVVYPYLKTLLPGGYVNLFVRSADYPGIADVDGDGDLDILTFGVLGSFFDLHKNMSMEKYGTADSLDYERTTYCWGHIAESDESNVIYTDTCMARTHITTSSESRNERHSGSTLLLHDLDGNGLSDLILGDVDYPGLFALYNTGSLDDAYITVVDTSFPQVTERVNLFSMPVVSYTDVNNDNVKDLLVSPFDPSIITSMNKNSSWLYFNMGSDSNPIFELQETNFLQSQMIDVGSGAYPVMFDWDGDGLKDLFVGNYGYYQYSYYLNYFLHSVYYSQIAYFKNVGTQQNPVFELLNEDFAGLGSLQKTGLIPTFDDINGDGSIDLLVGNSDGKIINVVYNNLDESFTVVSEDYLSIDVGDFSAPQLFDVNRDGLKDLLIGARAGNIVYYKNNGSAGNPDFTFITDSLGKVNVTDYNVSWNGYSTPSFFIDSYDNIGLLVGSEQGVIYYFTDIDNNLNGTFTESNQLNILLDTSNVSFDRGMRTGATICNLYEDGKTEMIVGNYSGGLEYFNGNVSVLYDNIAETNFAQLEIYPNPASDELNINLLDEKGLATFTLYNSFGLEVKSQSDNVQNQNIVMNISNLEDGVYILVSIIGSKVYKNKIVVLK